MKKPFIVVMMGEAYNMNAESIEEVREEFGPDCTVFEEVKE